MTERENIPTPTRIAELSFAVAQIAGKARWLGSHGRVLDGLESKAAKEARADANTLAEAAIALLALVPFGSPAKSAVPSPSVPPSDDPQGITEND